MEVTVGIIKDVDSLGRIVIPKEFRELYGLTASVEILPTKSGILLRNPEYKLVRINKDNKKDK